MSLSFDQFGNLFFTYINFDTGNVPVALSTDGGATFNEIAQIEPTGGGPSGPAIPNKRPSSLAPDTGNDQPTITTGNGAVWITTTGIPSGHIQATFRCVVRQGSIDPKTPEALSNRVHTCWINPTLDGATPTPSAAAPSATTNR